jgi:hypothetical protein
VLTTEEEAKTKRCQEAFGDGFTSAACTPVMTTVPMNPFGHSYSGSHGVAVAASPAFCIGSACMAWRWHRQIDPFTGENVSVPVGTERFGYCGKAGRP